MSEREIGEILGRLTGIDQRLDSLATTLTAAISAQKEQFERMEERQDRAVSDLALRIDELEQWRSTANGVGKVLMLLQPVVVAVISALVLFAIFGH